MHTAIVGLLLIILISALGAWFLMANKAVEKPVKAMLFVGYFWLLAFTQMVLFTAIYYFWPHT